MVTRTPALVEELPDEDVIHYYTNGTEYFAMENGRLKVKNTGGSVFIGDNAGVLDDLSDNNNVFIGSTSGYINTTGSNNVGVSSASLFTNNIGGGNTAIGSSSLRNNTQGVSNTAIGQQSQNNNKEGGYNTSVGVFSLYSNINGHYNSALGYETMKTNSTGESNVAIGARALYSNAVKSNLVAIGDSALYNNGTGANALQAKYNVAVGSKALYANTTGKNNTAIGYNALKTNTSADGNTAMGQLALHENLAGAYNTAIGTQTLNKNNTGEWNVAIGSNAMNSNLSGSKNVAFGTLALASNYLGNNNTAIGNEAGNSSIGSGNIFIGNRAGYNETDSNKLYISNSDTINPLVYGNFEDNHLRINGRLQIGNPSVNYQKGYSFPQEGTIYPGSILVLDPQNSKLEWKENKPVSISDTDTWISTDPSITSDKDEIWMYVGGKEVARFDSSGLIMMKQHKKVHYKSYPISDFVPTNVEYDYHPNPPRYDGVGADTTYDMPWDFFIKDNLYLSLRPGPLFGNTDVITALDLPHGAHLDSLGITIKENTNMYYDPVCFKILKTNIKTGQQQYIIMADGFIGGSLGSGFHSKSVGYYEIIDNQNYYYSIVVTTYFANVESVYLVGAFVKYSTTETISYNN